MHDNYCESNKFSNVFLLVNSFWLTAVSSYNSLFQHFLSPCLLRQWQDLNPETWDDEGVFYHCATTVLPLFYHCATTVLPLCYHCATTVLPLCYHCWPSKSWLIEEFNWTVQVSLYSFTLLIYIPHNLTNLSWYLYITYWQHFGTILHNKLIIVNQIYSVLYFY